MIYTTVQAKRHGQAPTKTDRLRATRRRSTRSPEAVRAPWFAPAGFFDANDLVQVKYEMLRHARQDGVTKAEAASLFGLSRPTFYQAEAAFERDGLAGSAAAAARAEVGPQAHPRGDEPRSSSTTAAGGPMQARALAQAGARNSWVSRCTRAASSARSRAKKNADADPRHRPATLPTNAADAYETLARSRCCTAKPAPMDWAPSSSTACGSGLAVLLRRQPLRQPAHRRRPRCGAGPGRRTIRQLVRLLANMVLAARNRRCTMPTDSP